MKGFIADQMHKLRHQTRYSLVENSPIFTEESNFFGKNRAPLMCDFTQNRGHPLFETYESGNRSILLETENGWLKAKGIGIPSGVSRPIYDGEKVYTYLLYDEPNMCHKTILWGFMQEQEHKCELYGAKKAQELGQRIKFQGYTHFDARFIKMRNREELFNVLNSASRESLHKKLLEEGEKTTAYSVYTSVPSDIRVGELFYALMFPRVTELIDSKIIKEYVEYLGTSCGHLLRTYHNAGALHGTWVGDRATSLGLRDVHSNSYTGNYLVDEDGLTMCDFDLAKPVEKESEKPVEKWALVHVENPLYYAGSYMPMDTLSQGIAKKNPFREELAIQFSKAVDIGYSDYQGDLEKSFKREILGLLVKAKLLMWKLYELPEDLAGNIYYVDYQIANKKIDDNRFKKTVSDFW